MKYIVFSRGQSQQPHWFDEVVLMLKQALALLYHPRTHAACIALLLVWAYLQNNPAPIYLALLLLGPFMACTTVLRKRPLTRVQHHLTTAVQCALINMLGTLVHATGISSNLFMVSLAFTHFWMMFMSEDSDRMSYRASHAVAYLMMLETLVPIGFHLAETPVPVWLVTLVFIASYATWRRAMWYTMDMTPMSIGQHDDYWPAVFKQNPIDVFWMTLRNYAIQRPLDAMPKQLHSAVSNLSMAQLLDYLKDTAVDAPHLRTVDDCIADAAKDRVSELEPRAAYIWQIFGENEVIAAVQAIESLNAPSKSTETWDLPCLA